MGRLTTHVLDTTRGRAAGAVAIELQRYEGEAWRTVARAVTNADGRCDAPLLSPESFAAGVYQLLFHIGDYFRETAGSAAASPFLDIVPIRFTLAADGGHYHVPLVVTPWSYSTYRGS
ncbi:MAG: hydroxyisourate hydrolase [Pseudomonadota bacterium]|nr:hydroxyisourate hydrolase [Pseudomonadota bacterium]